MLVKSMIKIIKTDKAPLPSGPYSQAIRAGNFLFISGQIPIDPKTGKKIKDDVSLETKQIMENIKAILESENLSLNNVVKVTVFLKDIRDFQKMNDVYKEYFKDYQPARTTVQATPAGDVDIEIDAIAYIP